MKITNKMLSKEQNFQPIGEPFKREWFTFVGDEHGNHPPMSEWTKHEVEYVIIEVEKLEELKRLAGVK